MPIIDKCPICNNKLEEIFEDGYVIDYWCTKCGIYWDLEDLEFTPNQKSVLNYLK